MYLRSVTDTNQLELQQVVNQQKIDQQLFWFPAFLWFMTQ